MRASNCVLIILFLVLTALLSLIVLFIAMTEEPEIIFPKKGMIKEEKDGRPTEKPGLEEKAESVEDHEAAENSRKNQDFSTRKELVTTPIPGAKMDSTEPSKPAKVDETTTSPTPAEEEIPTEPSESSTTSTAATASDLEPANQDETTTTESTTTPVSDEHSTSTPEGHFGRQPVSVSLDESHPSNVETADTEISFLTEGFDAAHLDLLPRRYLVKITELHMKNPGKIVDISVRNKHFLHAAKSHGEIDVFNSTSLQYLRSLHTQHAIHRLDYFADGRMAVSENLNSTLRIMDGNGKIVEQLKVDYHVLDVRVLGDKVFTLSRQNSTIHQYSARLQLERQLRSYELAPNEACNFILPLDDFLYLSCQAAVRRLAYDGQLLASALVPGSAYGLALVARPGAQLWCAQRGRAELHVYDAALEFRGRLAAADQEPALWSGLAFDGDFMFALDHVMNRVSMYRLPAEAARRARLAPQARRAR